MRSLALGSSKIIIWCQLRRECTFCIRLRPTFFHGMSRRTSKLSLISNRFLPNKSLALSVWSVFFFQQRQMGKKKAKQCNGKKRGKKSIRHELGPEHETVCVSPSTAVHGVPVPFAACVIWNVCVCVPPLPQLTEQLSLFSHWPSQATGSAVAGSILWRQEINFQAWTNQRV